MEGVAHQSFMDASKAPKFVTSHDLKPGIAEDAAHALIADAMANFIFAVLGNAKAKEAIEAL